jgi:hypothetical protein
MAAIFGHVVVIKSLVDQSSDPETYKEHGFNAMFEALHSPYVSLEKIFKRNCTVVTSAGDLR